MLTLDIEKVDSEIAARVAQRYVLKDIYLVGGKISRDPLTVSPETLSLQHKCSTNVHTPFDAEKYIFLCNFRVAAFDGKEPDKLIMKIEASFCTSYVISQPDPLIPEDGLDFFIEYIEYIVTINPISHAWPYWREFVQSMSSRMGFPALTVPLLEIAPEKTATKRGKSQPAKKVSTRRKKLSA